MHPEGQGKALSGAVINCASVMFSLFLYDSYPDYFKQMKDNGYPMPVFAGVLAFLISYALIWWTSKSLVSRVISFILDFKRIIKAAQDPLPPQ